MEQWHDLTKDSNDVPEEGRHIVYGFKYKDVKDDKISYGSARAHRGLIEFFKGFGQWRFDYICWKYLDEFDGEEDESD